MTSDAVLATNTSSLSVASIASACEASERVIGIHFFNPAPVMPLVEVVPWLGGDADGRAGGVRADASGGRRRRCSRRTRRASSSIASRVRSTAKSIRLLEEGIADVADDRLGDEGARRIPHGTVRADGLHRQRRELRGDAVGVRGDSSTIRATVRRSRSGVSSRPAFSARRAGAATTTIATAPSRRSRATMPQVGAADLRPRARDADQRGGRRRAHARRVAGGHRSRDDQGGKLSQGLARLGERDRARPRAGVARATCRPSTARTAIVRARCFAAWCATSAASSNEPSADEQALAERVVAAMMAKDAFSQSLGMEVVDVRPRASAVRMIGARRHGERLRRVSRRGRRSRSPTAHWRSRATRTAASRWHRQLDHVSEGESASGDVLTATAEEESATNRLGFYRVTVRRGDDESVALFRGTVYKTEQAFLSRSRMTDAYIVDGVRTAVGNIGGGLSEVRADDLGRARDRRVDAAQSDARSGARHRRHPRLREPGGRRQSQRRAHGAAARRACR